MSAPYNYGIGTLYFGTTATVVGMVSQDITYTYKNNVKVSAMDENGRLIAQRQDDLWTNCDVSAIVASGSFLLPGNTFTVSSSLMGNFQFILDDLDIKASNKDYVKATMKGTNYQYLASGSL